MNYEKIPAPLWANGGEGEKTAYGIIIDMIEDRRQRLPEFSEPQMDELVQLMWAAMDRGWEAAMMTSRYRAVRRANSKRAAAADAKRDAIRATYDRLAKSGEVTIQAVAESCGVSVATAYRAMGEKKRRR